MDGRRSETSNDVVELGKLREMAKIASIYHSTGEKFQRNPNLSHLVQASLNLCQFIVAAVIETFHHVHHYVVRRQREQDKSVPKLPEEKNPLFFIYPVCILMSFVFCFLWLYTNVFMKRPEIVLTGCFTAAFLMLLMGIVEMKHAEMYLDLTVISDAELLTHPIFIHNFIMCLLSIFCMSLYLLQAWVTCDYWISIREQRNISDDSNADTDIIRVLERESKAKEEPGELDPIPSLDKFPSLSALSVTNRTSVEEEPVLLYCCFADCYNYIKHNTENRAMHEFQVVHVM